MDDIPFNCGRELVFLVGSVACPLQVESEDVPSGAQDKILEPSAELYGEFEPCSFGLFPETAPETRDESLNAVWVEDLHPDETSEEGQEKNSLPESELPTSAVQTGEKRKRIKIVARRSRTPRTRPQPRFQPSETPSSPPSSKPSRKSARIALKSVPRTSRSSAPVIEEISSSSSLSGSDSEDPSFKQGTPVFSEPSDEQNPSIPTTSTKSSASKTPLKRKLKTTPLSKTASPAPQIKKTKLTTPSPLSEKHAQFLKRNVVRGKVVNIQFFEEQGLGVFLNKLRVQGWLELFANTHQGCSVAELAEFYANCSVTNGVVTSAVNEWHFSFDAATLGEILGVPSRGFDVYVREDKTALDPARLLEISRRVSQKPGLRTPSSVKKGDLIPLHQLLFMFIIKNVIPRGQGRNSADLFDQCLVDFLSREEPINLPAIMIRHFGRITNTTRNHDLGYGFLLTKVFEHLGIELTRRVPAQLVDEIGVDTLMGCGYEVGQGSTHKQGPRPPRPPVSETPSPSVEAVLEDHARLKEELSAVKSALEAEKAISAKRHEELLALLSSLAPSIPPLQTKPPSAP